MTDEIRAPKRDISTPRRATSALLGRHWFSLFTELVLIVAGILIALYIDGWVEARRDHDLETVYLELLLDDLGQIEAEVVEYVQFEKDILATGKSLLDATAAERLPGDEIALQAMLAKLTVRRTLRIVSDAYADMIGTGNLRLIHDRDLRGRIIRYFFATDRAELIAEKNNKAYVDEIFVRFVMDQGITIRHGESPLAAVNAATAILADALGPEFAWPRDEALAKPPRSRSWDDIRRQVVFRIRIAATGAALGSQVIDATQRLRSDIENELQRRDTD